MPPDSFLNLERLLPLRLLAKNPVISDFLLQFVHADIVLTRQHQKLPGGQAQLFKQLVQGGERGGLYVILDAREVFPATDAFTQEDL